MFYEKCMQISAARDVYSSIAYSILLSLFHFYYSFLSYIFHWNMFLPVKPFSFQRALWLESTFFLRELILLSRLAPTTVLILYLRIIKNVHTS